MKKFWIIVLTFFVLCGLIPISYFILYPLWGRRLIYSPSNTITKYAGSGQITKLFNEQLFIIPKGVGRPFFVPLEEKLKYTEEFYEIFSIPSQDQLLYTVGYFQEWEDITNSFDKYIVIKNPVTKNLEKYRVAFEDSDLFKDNTTNLSIENVGVRLNTKTTNILENAKISNLVMMGYLETKNIFKNGDVVILTPIFDPPELAKKDELGNYLVSWIIVRRIGGKI